MPKTSTTTSIRPPNAALGDGQRAVVRRSIEGERLEEPLATVPYPLEPCHGACLDTRDLQLEDDAVRYRTARW